MISGRKPKPTRLKVLEGNPGKRPLPADEPEPRMLSIECPEMLQGEARVEWERLAPELSALGLLTTVDRAGLVAYCQAWGRLVMAEAFIAEQGVTYVLRDKDGRTKCVVPFPHVAMARQSREEIRKWATEFGFTPSSRSRVAALRPIEPNDEDAIFFGGTPTAKRRG